MAFKPKDANGRVAIVAGEIITGVALEREIQNGVKVRPTNVTAVISTVAGTGSTVSDTERNNSLILLQNGPKGGFTQTGNLAAGSYWVNDVVRGVITDR